MNLVRPVFTEYERQVLHGMARRRLQPTLVQRVLDASGKPVGRLFKLARQTRNPFVHGLSSRVQGWVQEGLIQTVKTAGRLTSPREALKRAEARGMHLADAESMRYLPLSDLDAIADTFRAGHRMLLGLEGALLGSATTLMEGVPGAQLIIPSLIIADVSASLTLLSRQTCHVASVYGFPATNPENLPHIIAAMAPQTEMSEEGYFAIKTAVAASIRETTRFTARTAHVVIDRTILEREAPQMLRLIASVAERLGVTLTQKELGVLVPIAGAVLNSSINMAFQRICYDSARDYFRLLLLEDRYGSELVAVAVAQEIDALKRRA